jgi:hypothetical protein
VRLRRFRLVVKEIRRRLLLYRSSPARVPVAGSVESIAGITATGTLGEKPKVSFKAPKTVDNNSYAVLQEGNGATIADGDRLCSQGIAISVKDGTELASRRTHPIAPWCWKRAR